MQLFHLLRSLIACILLIGIIFVVTTKSDFITKLLSALHIPQLIPQGQTNTRAHTITQQMTKDIGNQLQLASNQAKNIKRADIMSFLSRAQIIRQDVLGIQTSLTKQVNQMVNKK